ncbi:MAG: bifunctional hydroxymethylpyrimidine kinase/phosphomethylpyrimidine kinase [Deltaproteobacteria bacterium]
MIALTIAGSDPSGGAGVARDLETFATLGVRGMSVLSCLTAQNSQQVDAVEPVPAAFVAQQLATLLRDFRPAASKTGLLASAEAVVAVADVAGRLGPLVVDPVLASTSGSDLVAAGVREAILTRLLPQAALVTPNLAEAGALTETLVTDLASMRRAAEILLATGVKAVLVKGGHLAGDPVDLLLTSERSRELHASRIDVPPVRGTGCALSAAITAGLAQGKGLEDAIDAARAFLGDALGRAEKVGGGAWHLGRSGV